MYLLFLNFLKMRYLQTIKDAILFLFPLHFYNIVPYRLRHSNRLCCFSISMTSSCCSITTNFCCNVMTSLFFFWACTQTCTVGARFLQKNHPFHFFLHCAQTLATSKTSTTELSSAKISDILIIDIGTYCSGNSSAEICRHSLMYIRS